MPAVKKKPVSGQESITSGEIMTTSGNSPKISGKSWWNIIPFGQESLIFTALGRVHLDLPFSLGGDCQNFGNHSGKGSILLKGTFINLHGIHCEPVFRQDPIYTLLAPKKGQRA